MSWIPIALTNIELGDYIRCESYTHSQKWLEVPGYNQVIEGRVILVTEEINSPADIMIETKGSDSKGSVERLGPDLGSSGGYMVWIRTHTAPSPPV
jgi:hypothetical protein